MFNDKILKEIFTTIILLGYIIYIYWIKYIKNHKPQRNWRGHIEIDPPASADSTRQLKEEQKVVENKNTFVKIKQRYTVSTTICCQEWSGNQTHLKRSNQDCTGRTQGG